MGNKSSTATEQVGRQQELVARARRLREEQLQAIDADAIAQARSASVSSYVAGVMIAAGGWNEDQMPVEKAVREWVLNEQHSVRVLPSFLVADDLNVGQIAATIVANRTDSDYPGGFDVVHFVAGLFQGRPEEQRDTGIVDWLNSSSTDYPPETRDLIAESVAGYERRIAQQPTTSLHAAGVLRF